MKRYKVLKLSGEELSFDDFLEARKVAAKNYGARIFFYSDNRWKEIS